MSEFYDPCIEIMPPGGKAGPFPPLAYHLSTNKDVPTVGYDKTGVVKVVTHNNFPVLKGVTSFLLEIFEAMQ